MAGLRGGRRFRPTLWPTLWASLAALATLLVLLGLGVWQLQRLAWKQALIAERTARLSAPAVDFPAAGDDPADLELRRLRASGRFDHQRELYLGSKTFEGRVGFHIVTPFALTDGRVVLVDRGWVPPERRALASRPQDGGEGLVTLEAVLRTAGWKGGSWFQPENDPEANYWLWIDGAAMLARAEVGADRAVTEVYLQQVAGTRAGGTPARPPPVVDLRNDHLQYAITWFALAAALLVICLLLHLRGPDGEG